jgi:hypothetical protein
VGEVGLNSRRCVWRTSLFQKGGGEWEDLEDVFGGPLWSTRGKESMRLELW